MSFPDPLDRPSRPGDDDPPPEPRGGLRIGVDLGGTKIEVVALVPDGRALFRQRIPTPRDDYEATLDAVAGLVRELERAVSVPVTVGIGHPGSISPATGLLRGSNSTWLNGRPLGRDLEARIGHPVRLANDANCFTLSEACDGAGAGRGSVFGVILGTGTGGGFIHSGRLAVGRNAVAGEWGHLPLPWMTAEEHPGPTCWCGRRGCLETYLSGPGLGGDHARATGREMEAPAVVAAAARGDGEAVATLHRYVDRLARGLALVIDLLDPDAIVLGGGLSNLRLLYEAVPARWERYVFSDRVETELLAPVHGDSSGVRGAARLWDDPEAA